MTALIRIDSSWPPGTAGAAKAIRFCSRCGEPAEEPPQRDSWAARPRVCRTCEMGLMLSCSREALPGPGAAFLIATLDLCVSAVSEAGERVFGSEHSIVGLPMLALVTSPLGDDLLARRVAHAAQRAREPVVLPLRLRSEEASRVGTMAARVSTCGPPRAALVTVEPSGFGRG